MKDMLETDLTSARTAVHQALFRAIRSYTATSCLSSLSLVALEDLLPIFRKRSEPALRTLGSITDWDTSLLERLKEHSDVDSVVSTQNAIAAACLVFSHSLADVAVAELCSIAADFNQPYWARTVATSRL